MSYESSKRYKENDGAAPRAWVSLLALSLLAVMMVITLNIALNMYPKRSDFFSDRKKSGS